MSPPTMTPGSHTQRVLVRYNEIALKGANRGFFEDRLMHNIRQSLHSLALPELRVTHRANRVHISYFVEDRSAAQHIYTRVGAKLHRVFGISSISQVTMVPSQLEVIKQSALNHFQEAAIDFQSSQGAAPKTFAVRTKRSDKIFDLSSIELDHLVGGVIRAAYPELRVDLNSPDVLVGLEVRSKETLLWSKREEGIHGLPVGVNAPLLALLSGGIDSPVAAIQMLRRGSRVTPLHFFGGPFIGQEALEKIFQLTEKVNQFQPKPQPLIVIPFGSLQEKIALHCPSRYRTVLYRRMMLRIAQRIAIKYKFFGVISGESVGQVASQTLENLNAIQDAAPGLLVLRPLISEDKDEILERARKWGTLTTSLRPAADSCTLFADQHPILNPSLPLIHELESKMPIEDWVNDALASGYRTGQKT
jgi:thiamine biosynthesis protein ThiI